MRCETALLAPLRSATVAASLIHAASGAIAAGIATQPATELNLPYCASPSDLDRQSG